MKRYMTDEQAKELILETGKRMYRRGFVAANDGNISVKVSDSEIWVTPTGVSKGYMSWEILVKMDIDGNIIEGGTPSSEVKMHLAVYRENPDIGAVIHAHPPAATAFAAAGLPLDKAVLQEAVVQLGVVPLAKYATPGSKELAESTARFCREFNGALLENHGAVTWGETLRQAMDRFECMEQYAQVLLNMKMLGSEKLLTEEQIDELILLRSKWGIKTGGRPKGR